jgi:NADH pyrophosphatase NudC (nudix superfamily)
MTIHVSRDGEEIGQYTQQAFNDLIQHGRLFPTDYFWVDGMDEWKPLSLAKSYLGHREKCRHCGGKMTEQRPVTEGRHQGGTKSICLKCGHTEYHHHGS